jgi:integrase
VKRGFDPMQVASGVVDENGEPKYGMHALRHACASLWIENGMNTKRIQKLMGHSTIQMTFDVYGHLFTDGDADQRAAEDIQVRLLGK